MTQLQIGEGLIRGIRVARRKTVIFPAPEKSSAIHYDAPELAPPLVASPTTIVRITCTQPEREFPVQLMPCIKCTPVGQGWRKGESSHEKRISPRAVFQKKFMELSLPVASLRIVLYHTAVWDCHVQKRNIRVLRPGRGARPRVFCLNHARGKEHAIGPRSIAIFTHSPDWMRPGQDFYLRVHCVDSGNRSPDYFRIGF